VKSAPGNGSVNFVVAAELVADDKKVVIAFRAVLAAGAAPKQDDRARMQGIHETADGLLQSRVIYSLAEHAKGEVHKTHLPKHISHAEDLEQYFQLGTLAERSPMRARGAGSPERDRDSSANYELSQPPIPLSSALHCGSNAHRKGYRALISARLKESPVSDVPLPVLLFAFATFLLAGFVKGFTGMGLPTVGTGILTIVMTPAQAAGLLVMPNFVTNIWQAFAGGQLRALLRRFWPMLAGIFVGTAPGAGFLTGNNAGRAAMALGAMLIVYALLVLLSVRFSVPRRTEWWMGPVTGALTGFISVLTGVFAIPLVPYLNALSLKREELIQTLGLSFLTASSALALALARDGALPLSLIGASAFALAPAGLGMFAGLWLRQRAHPDVFVRVFAGVLMMIGLHLVLRNLI
jgi:uncharacterized membrane protein YfcA